MRNEFFLFTSALGFIILLIQLASFLSAENDQLALVGGTIYINPTEEPIRNGFVLIQNGKISAVNKKDSQKLPADVEIIDCSGMTITSGFWNSHVHFFERKWTDAAKIPASEVSKQLEEMFTRYGFTNVFDLGSMWENTRTLRDRIESGEIAGPKIRSTGEALIAKGAMPSEKTLTMLGYMSFPAPEITDAAQAFTATKKLLDAGVDGIKLHLQPPPPPNSPFPESAIPATVSEAHRLGKPVFVHPNTAADVLAAVRGGVDVVAHTTPRSGPWDESLLTAMKERQVALTPTLTLWKYFTRHERISTQEQLVQTAVGQLQAWLNNEGTILFGNDIGAVEYDPGDEYALMSRAGMNFSQILASLTTSPAERFGESKQAGQIKPGFKADLVVLNEDPSLNIHALAAVQFTIRNGKVIYKK